VRALISGQAGIAVLIEGEEYASMEVRSLDPVPRTGQDVAHLLRDANDLLELEGISKEEAAHELDIAWRRDRSLHLALIALDGQAHRENRESAAKCLADLLRGSSVTDFLRNRFYAAPLPAPADLPGALKLAESSGSADFAKVLRAVSADQESIRHAREAWDAVRPDLFGGPAEKERFGFAAVQSGAFRLLALDNPDEAQARFLEFIRNHRLEAKWDVHRLFKRWQKLTGLASGAQLAPHMLEEGGAIAAPTLRYIANELNNRLYVLLGLTCNVLECLQGSGPMDEDERRKCCGDLLSAQEQIRGLSLLIPQPLEMPGTAPKDATILLVEDDEHRRTLFNKVLSDSGFTVIQATGSYEAIEAIKDNKRYERIDLLVADIGLPDIAGPELAAYLHLKRPDMKVIFTSGYPRATLDSNAAPLVKPLPLSVLVATVRDALADARR
jgi:CheY-like chemotaxis protein